MKRGEVASSEKLEDKSEELEADYKIRIMWQLLGTQRIKFINND